ncbi:hypothetical protein LTR08_009322 [Meristemomyces frigidus]|nr:hypothetical protein LTR08_009322 [Meristemomyces frigidus]
MHFSTLTSATLLALASLATANPCLTYNDANTLATNFGKLISAYSNKLANQTLTPGFVDYSESVNSLIDNGGTGPTPLLGATFTSRAKFEAGSAPQPAVPFTVKNLWYNCNTITIRWESDQKPQPVVGISVAQTVYAPVTGNPSKFMIQSIWAEFDSAAWAVNLGVLVPAPKKEKKREVAFEG